MSSLSPRAFSSVALSLGLLLGLATAFPTPLPVGEKATDDAAPTELPINFSNGTRELITYILSKISLLKEEMCSKYGKCEDNQEILAENSLSLPKLEEIDGCFQSGFNQEICLMRITSGLLEFQIYLEHLQKVFEGDKKNARDVHNYTKTLVELLKQNVKNPDEVTTLDPSRNANVLKSLQSQKDWLQSTTFRVMLKSLEEFLRYSVRATRKM